MPEPNPLSLANSYLGLAADQLLADDQGSAAALFVGVECLEIQSQVSELGAEGARVVAVVSPAQALAVAARPAEPRRPGASVDSRPAAASPLAGGELRWPPPLSIC